MSTFSKPFITGEAKEAFWIHESKLHGQGSLYFLIYFHNIMLVSLVLKGVFASCSLPKGTIVSQVPGYILGTPPDPSTFDSCSYVIELKLEDGRGFYDSSAYKDAFSHGYHLFGHLINSCDPTHESSSVKTANAEFVFSEDAFGAPIIDVNVLNVIKPSLITFRFKILSF